MEAITRMFTPEFRNRLDQVVQFGSLDERTMANVVDKFIIELETQLQDKHVTFEVDDEARSWLGHRGFDAVMGARPMARVIQENIKRRLAEEMLFGRLEGGGHVKITVKDDALDFEFVSEKDEKAPADTVGEPS